MYPYISITDQEIEEMLKTIGISSTDELYSDIPENVQFKGELNIPKAKSEVEVRRYFDEIFAKNTLYRLWDGYRCACRLSRLWTYCRP